MSPTPHTPARGRRSAEDHRSGCNRLQRPAEPSCQAMDPGGRLSPHQPADREGEWLRRRKQRRDASWQELGRPGAWWGGRCTCRRPLRHRACGTGEPGAATVAAFLGRGPAHAPGSGIRGPPGAIL